MLHEQVIEGSLGADKRIVYVTEGDKEHLQTLQWVFEELLVRPPKDQESAEDRDGYPQRLRLLWRASTSLEVFT